MTLSSSSESQRLDQQAFSLAAKMGIASFLQGHEQIDVEVESDLVKIAQGEADAVRVAGKKWVFNSALQIHQLEIQTSQIAINPLSVLAGNIELQKPIHATAYLSFTQSDLNIFINSDIARDFIRNISLEIEDKVFRINPHSFHLSLSKNDRISIQGDVTISEGESLHPFQFEGTLKIRSEIPRVHLEAFRSTNGYGISVRLAVALLEGLNQLIDRPYFDILGTVLQVEKIAVQESAIALFTNLQIKQFPQSQATDLIA
ncbi:DUF2993 domain-containing protein [Desertifilum sp. FACHB-1129]|uniref:DUF2993 domain-containing protein n=2 Tax=Desertifilum tharense IPPAS B-1220 TaxID=1781255 RepID=A0A1E5QNR0_9CYAN|nr:MULTISPECIES: DUF2993 domain-containing protein [Desertifilum]MDA0209346.1 DUF2993 domain-containing protein [Cyanobacteria bacterium FC1]MBD2311620.1 DUF2993 domain-containing protein [Desertifilum sp. FACHB-1129]MBD2322855.1 DUF2993 domain-containing protein [Desertifilum sp. FACHB-866]MBD2332751.1 DUF2993 domain-containing protein [Desertifilum sp. FACHB-868]OEJ76312.1 hypothetical protein BH720_04695 [Desertifilum tharense IPPAS B-1220]